MVDYAASERLHFSLSCIGEGNGNPLQCSCLENPGTGEPGGLPSMGSHRVGHDWSNLAAAAVYICQSQSPSPSYFPSLLGIHMFVLHICVSISALQISSSIPFFWASLVAQMIEKLPAMQKTRVWFLGWEDPLEKVWQPTPVFLPGEFHGQKSLVGYTPWSCKESETTEWL